MCDTFLHPRPAFSTFLRSDASGPCTVRKCPRVYLKWSDPSRKHEHYSSKDNRLRSANQTFHPIYTPLIDSISGTVSSAIELNLTGEQSKASSGGYAKFYDDCSISKPPHRTTPSLNAQHTFTRPQTAPARIAKSTPDHVPDIKDLVSERMFAAEALTEELINRHKVTQHYETNGTDVSIETEESGVVAWKIVGGVMVPKMTVSLPPSQSARDALELKTRYTSVSRNTMEEIPWTVRSAPAVLKPHARETRPDMVRERVHRYETKSHAWQAIGPAFDRASPRKHTFYSKPITFISESRQTQYTPGYTGEVPLVSGELGVPGTQLVKRTEVRRDLPPPTALSRKANIPGYTGRVRPGTTKPAHYLTPASTQALTHRAIPVVEGCQGEGYPRANPISNQVTLTHPYNPYNKVNPTIRQRA